MSKINLRTESAVFKNPTLNVPKQTLDELVPIDSRFVIPAELVENCKEKQKSLKEISLSEFLSRSDVSKEEILRAISASTATTLRRLYGSAE